MKKKGYVYLICDNKNEVFKIGVTKKSIDKRIKELQTGNATELFISKYHESEYPYMVENMLHSHFNVNKVLNEWFELSADNVNKFNEICDEMENRIESLKDNPFFKKLMK
jgi:hypothetical protein